MLRNYLKMAFKVLLRRKFYTFISMFGITLTLAILLIVSAFWEHVAGTQAPEVNLDRSLVVLHSKLKLKEGGNQGSSLSSYFMEQYVSKMKTPEMVSFYTWPLDINTYVGGQKVSISRKYTDAAFWQVMQHRYLEGRPYSAEEVANRAAVVVLSRALKDDLFGKGSALGKEVVLEQDRYQVIGVIENTPITRLQSYGTLFVPYTLHKRNGNGKSLIGEYAATLVAADKASVDDMQLEFQQMVQQIGNPDPAKYTSFYSSADPYVAAHSRVMLGGSDGSGVEKLYTILFVLAFLFMLLPTINLMNINISRMMERSSEIGVRKAFGASSFSLVVQFTIENLFLTLLSGLFALVVAYLALMLINSIQLVNYMSLNINLNVLGVGLLFTIVFGLLSGVYPAWRMSKLHPAEAIKAQ